MKAPDDIVKLAIRETLSRQNIRSQRELAEIVNKWLKHGNTGYAISERRIRKLALEISGLRIMPRTKKGRMPAQCPACSGELKRTYTKTLKGSSIVSELYCARCGYRGKQGRWLPRNYEFTLR
ncbi:MAG: hypothetical protein HY367_03380 [Candidatus Aenigmarchaeota archaeon]|nr:hypothetical protein [Candidatus Aenigmarchaeota archaeon]